jgi:catechol 2,3-dioxygenase-like lactoylglutathione lyase family enzyme
VLGLPVVERWPDRDAIWVLAAAVALLRARGAEVEEHAFAAYAGSRAAYVHDPDGNVVELWTWDVGHSRR